MKKYAVLASILLLASMSHAQQRPLPPKPERELVWGEKEPFADKVLSDGDAIRIIRDKEKGLTVAVVGYDSGDHFVYEITVVNEAEGRINVIPEDFFSIYWDKDKKFGYMYPLAPEKVAKKYQSRAKWGNFFRSFAAGVATNTTTATDNYGNSVTVTSPNTTAQRNAAIQNQNAANAANAKAGFFLDSALRSNTIFPNNNISGLVYFERKKYKNAKLYMIINGTAYEFWFSGLQK
jgi:hypothetical protein